jgi:hypothetical protein
MVDEEAHARGVVEPPDGASTPRARRSTWTTRPERASSAVTAPLRS